MGLDNSNFWETVFDNKLLNQSMDPNNNRPKSVRPHQNKILQQVSGTYLYQVLQPELKDKHNERFKEISAS